MYRKNNFSFLNQLPVLKTLNAHIFTLYVVELYVLKRDLSTDLFNYAFGFSQFERGIRAKTTKPPAMRVVSKNVIQNNHHSFYNEGVQAIKIRKNCDYNG